MPTIHVELFEGRTVEQKAALAKGSPTPACVCWAASPIRWT